MTYRPQATAFRAILLASTMVLPLVSRGQPSDAAATQSGTADAIRVLFDQATFWRSQYQPQKADEALARVLALDPQNADALALQAQGAADAGNVEAAQKALKQLRAVRPDDPRIATIEQVLHAGPPDMAGVEEARRLSKDNKPTEAVEAFRRAFHGGTPPPALATEYYQMLSGSDGGWEPARAGLVAAIKANPDDLRSQLAYAELLTYRDETRDEGLDRLSKLMDYPAIARQADISYRKALFWLPSNPDSVPHYDVYMSRHPLDTEIATRETAAKNDLNAIRLAGYAALQAGNPKEAEADFNRALAANADDSDALLGLALTRFKQKREPEGRVLIRRVIELDPTKKDEFEKFLVEPPVQTSYRGGGGGDPRQAARIRGEYQRVAALTRRGDYAGAESLLHRLMGRRPNAGNELQLADIQASAGQTGDAERTYRQVLAKQPRNPLALAGLGRMLTQAGRFDEAETLFAQAGSRSSTAEVSRLRGEAYRMQAGSTSDTSQRVALLRQAVAADPANPWIRLELARMLLSQGHAAEGQAVMAGVTSSNKATSQQLLAGIYYANEAKNLQLAGALAARLPDRDRDPDIRAIQVRAGVEADLQQAHALGTPDAVRRQLFVLAAQPDPTGLRVGAFGQDLVRRGDKPSARELVRIALAARPPTPAQRIAYAGVLVGADYPNDAKAVAGRLQGVRLNPVQATNLATVGDNIAVSSADTLNGRGRSDDALNELQPRLSANPDSPDLNMALGRVYEAKQQTSRALELNEALLRRNPSNIDVRRSTISAAMAAGELRRANALADETRTLFPDDPQAWMISADVARARGQSGQALQDLRTARSLRQEQLRNGSQASANMPLRPTQDVAAAERATWKQYAQYVPANTASDASPSALPPIEAPDAQTDTRPDAVTREYSQYVPPANLNRNAAPARAPAPVPAQPDGYLSVPPGLEARAPATPDLDRALSTPVPQAPPPDRPAASTQPGVTTEYLPPDAPFTNRFAAAEPSPVQDEPSGAPSVLNQGPITLQQPADPVLRDIDRSIAQVSADVAPQLNGSASLRGRSGASGLEQLFEIATPLEASYSPAGYGRLKVQVTPTVLYAGQISSQDLPRFGTNPLATGAPIRARTQTTNGAGLDVGYAYDVVSADVGVTPLGFEQRNIVGGIEYAPRLTNRLTLRVLADRRSVTDSLLSEAGTEDPRSGIRWGGVTRNRGHVQLEGGIGTTNFYAGVGGGALLGNKVETNTEVDAGAGFSTPVYTDPTKEVRTGLDLVYFGFDKNLAGFTIGQGGYFSPQQFFAALVPVNFRHQPIPDLVYNVGGSLGWQTFRDKGEDVFAGQAGLQSQLVTLAATQPFLATQTSGTRKSGLAGGAHADIDYRVTDNLHVGAKAGFDRSGPFTEGTGLVYARYVFNDPQLTQ